MRMRILIVPTFLALLIIVCIANCGGGTGNHTTAGTGGAANCVADLKSIALTPAGSKVTLDGKSAAPITFSAEGTFADGATQPLDPAKLTWSVTRSDDTPP